MGQKFNLYLALLQRSRPFMEIFHDTLCILDFHFMIFYNIYTILFKYYYVFKYIVFRYMGFYDIHYVYTLCILDVALKILWYWCFIAIFRYLGFFMLFGFCISVFYFGLLYIILRGQNICLLDRFFCWYIQQFVQCTLLDIDWTSNLVESSRFLFCNKLWWSGSFCFDR